MKILVLGNGFDLDHDLPTSYYDFMNFCNKVLNKSLIAGILAAFPLKTKNTQKVNILVYYN